MSDGYKLTFFLHSKTFALDPTSAKIASDSKDLVAGYFETVTLLPVDILLRQYSKHFYSYNIMHAFFVSKVPKSTEIVLQIFS